MVTRRSRKVTRSAILFGAGLVGITAEAFYSLRYGKKPDSSLVYAFLAMLGLPVYLWHDKKGSRDDNDDQPKSRPPAAPRD